MERIGVNHCVTFQRLRGRVRIKSNERRSNLNYLLSLTIQRLELTRAALWRLYIYREKRTPAPSATFDLCQRTERVNMQKIARMKHHPERLRYGD